jgi:hypothetical protein
MYELKRQEEAKCQGLKLDERGSEKRAASIVLATGALESMSTCHVERFLL